MDEGGKRSESESFLIPSELEASAPQLEHRDLSLLVPESTVKCPVEEMLGQQPMESQCELNSHACVRGVGFLIRVFKSGELVCACGRLECLDVCSFEENTHRLDLNYLCKTST